MWKSLSEGVCGVVFTCNVWDSNQTLFKDVLDEVVTDVNVLGACMELGILGECDGRQQVGEDCRRSSWSETQVCEKLAQPEGVSYSQQECHVLPFIGWQGDCCLLLRSPNYHTTCWSEYEPRNRFSVQNTLSPVSIRISENFRGRISSAVGDGSLSNSLDIVIEWLNSSNMFRSWIFCELRKMLYCICYLGKCSKSSIK